MSAESVAKDSGWTVFALQSSGGCPVVVRSNLGDAEVGAFAADNVLVRIRCTMAPEQLNPAGMPTDAEPLNAFEDELVEVLGADAKATSRQVVVVTGDGSRDYYYSVVDGGEQLVGALKAIHKERPFEIKPLRIDESKPHLLKAFTPGMASKPQ